MSWRAVSLGMLLACSAARGLAADDWPDMADPPRAQVEIVARDVRINGVPSRIDHFQSELQPSEVLEFYRSRWSGPSFQGVRDTNSKQWRALAAITNGFQLVVQVQPRPEGGSMGVLSTLDFGHAEPNFLPKGLPRFDDVKITQVTESVDGPKRSNYVVMVSTSGFDINVNRWRDAWQRQGFTLSHESKPPDKDGVRTWIGLYDKPPQSVDISVVYRAVDRRTYITANLVTPSQGGWQP